MFGTRSMCVETGGFGGMGFVEEWDRVGGC